MASQKVHGKAADTQSTYHGVRLNNPRGSGILLSAVSLRKLFLALRKSSRLLKPSRDTSVEGEKRCRAGLRLLKSEKHTCTRVRVPGGVYCEYSSNAGIRWAPLVQHADAEIGVRTSFCRPKLLLLEELERQTS
jgi:hypothetical protein